MELTGSCLAISGHHGLGLAPVGPCVPEEEVGKTSTDRHTGCAGSDNRVSVHLPARIVTIVIVRVVEPPAAAQGFGHVRDGASLERWNSLADLTMGFARSNVRARAISAPRT